MSNNKLVNYDICISETEWRIKKARENIENLEYYLSVLRQKRAEEELRMEGVELEEELPL